MNLPVYNGTSIWDLEPVFYGGSAFPKFQIGTPGSPKLTILDNGNVGIGVTNPTVNLDVRGNGKTEACIFATTSDIARVWTKNNLLAYALGVDENGKGHIYKDINNPSAIMTFDLDGNIGIGANNTNSKLNIDAGSITGLRVKTTHGSDYGFGIISEVNGDNTKAIVIERTDKNNEEVFRVYGSGNVHAQSVYAKKIWAVFSPMVQFPDYVFEKNYDLISLYDVERYIIKNKHLPNIPSAKEVSKIGGIDVGKMSVNLLKNDEEQYLYLIELRKEIDELKTSLIELKKENEEHKKNLKIKLNK